MIKVQHCKIKFFTFTGEERHCKIDKKEHEKLTIINI